MEDTASSTDELYLDRRFFVLDETAFAAFEHQLNTSPPPNAKLRDLFRRPIRWSDRAPDHEG